MVAVRSMTGFGLGEASVGQVAASAEVRAVNHRGLKQTVRVSPSSGKLETLCDRLGKEALRRGAVQIAVRLTAVGEEDSAVSADVNLGQVLHYFDWAKLAAERAHVAPPSDVTPFFSLPGAIGVRETHFDDADAEAAVRAAVEAALEALVSFRQTEGAALAADLSSNLAALREGLRSVEERAPQVVAEYRDRMRDRVSEILARSGVELPEDSLIREVAVFADKADINEEISRLHSHLDQFETLLAGPDVVEGRKLDFLCQEMFREVNTIGSKANDITLSQTVVEMKSAAEKIREQVQNVE